MTRPYNILLYGLASMKGCLLKKQRKLLIVLSAAQYSAQYQIFEILMSRTNDFITKHLKFRIIALNVIN